ncbi:hypothetical protein FS837_012774 [Tulasnella sp. UAMH 9824]|nr:hypothetical protein FS837_012774 [Tulasnella sp. UAMH 9824]
MGKDPLRSWPEAEIKIERPFSKDLDPPNNLQPDLLGSEDGHDHPKEPLLLELVTKIKGMTVRASEEDVEDVTQYRNFAVMMGDTRNLYMAAFSGEDEYQSYGQLRILAEEASEESRAEGKLSMEKSIGYYRE